MAPCCAATRRISVLLLKGKPPTATKNIAAAARKKSSFSENLAMSNRVFFVSAVLLAVAVCTALAKDPVLCKQQLVALAMATRYRYIAMRPLLSKIMIDISAADL